MAGLCAKYSLAAHIFTTAKRAQAELRPGCLAGFDLLVRWSNSQFISWYEGSTSIEEETRGWKR